MWKNPGCTLTSKDYQILRSMLERCSASDEPMAMLLRQKIRNATVVGCSEVPDDVVTLNSRVTYRLGDVHTETRVIGLDRTSAPVGLLLPITTLRGLALLGLSEGQIFILSRSETVIDMLHLLEVHHQPERAGRIESAPRPRLRLVHGGAAADSVPRKKGMPSHLLPDQDDPGPSAA